MSQFFGLDTESSEARRIYARNNEPSRWVIEQQVPEFMKPFKDDPLCEAYGEFLDKIKAKRVSQLVSRNLRMDGYFHK